MRMAARPADSLDSVFFQMGRPVVGEVSPLDSSEGCEILVVADVAADGVDVVVGDSNGRE